jgi:hypothetical protein
MGLLVIPDLQLNRQKGFGAIRRGFDLPGQWPIRWLAAGLLSLYVRLTAEAEVEIRRFTRCPFLRASAARCRDKEALGRLVSLIAAGEDVSAVNGHCLRFKCRATAAARCFALFRVSTSTSGPKGSSRR